MSRKKGLSRPISASGHLRSHNITSHEKASSYVGNQLLATLEELFLFESEHILPQIQLFVMPVISKQK